MFAQILAVAGKFQEYIVLSFALFAGRLKIAWVSVTISEYSAHWTCVSAQNSWKYTVHLYACFIAIHFSSHNYQVSIKRIHTAVSLLSLQQQRDFLLTATASLYDSSTRPRTQSSTFLIQHFQFKFRHICITYLSAHLTWLQQNVDMKYTYCHSKYLWEHKKKYSEKMQKKPQDKHIFPMCTMQICFPRIRGVGFSYHICVFLLFLSALWS